MRWTKRNSYYKSSITIISSKIIIYIYVLNTEIYVIFHMVVFPCLWHYFSIILLIDPSGIKIIGGAGEDEEQDFGIFIKRIFFGGLVATDGKFKKNDIN